MCTRVSYETTAARALKFAKFHRPPGATAADAARSPAWRRLTRAPPPAAGMSASLLEAGVVLSDANHKAVADTSRSSAH